MSRCASKFKLIIKYRTATLTESLLQEVRGKRPFKIWDSSRNVRKGLVVTSFEELIHRGKEKLSVAANEPVRLVLESDGTQVEDGEYWRTLPPNTVLLLLRAGERWYPTGVDVIKAAISAIPKIVCETIHALELHDETPSWKIMDNKGRVTVVLHWDQRPHASPAARSPSRQPKPDRRPSLVIQTSLERPQPPPPHITVVNHDEPGPATARARLARSAGSLESAVHVHTAECARAGAASPHPTPHPPRPPQDECDFHCCALHEEGRRIAVHKSVATSPIQDAQPRASPHGRPKGHVRFLDAESARRGERDSSESETENTLVEEEAVTSEKFLLLIDQLSVEQKRHLTIKDIGIILERLSSKILDVERLDRESESDDCYNWTIKATIRGDALRELGVIYNGNYYAISEHPGYRDDNEDAADGGPTEEDRL
ncbi:Cell death activator CIDE-3 [Eumeta japonica]|uniref:Cell death activator CIDE-3 n=1 Tax=Eumeta variegata TaxID=151549 RepID=A0A4C1VXY8_EUMVA|nr:Cell death activator CIDE-3 [Eumeta japonica]